MADKSDTVSSTASSPAIDATVAAALAGPGADFGAVGGSEAKTRFNAAIEEARAGVEALRGQAIDRSNVYRARAVEGATDWVEDVKVLSGQAKERATQLAIDGKSRASGGLAALSQTVLDNAATIDQRFGVQYGNYARQAARSIQSAATKLETTDISEIAAEARTLVRTNPAAAIGAAAAVGYFFARLFRTEDE